MEGRKIFTRFLFCSFCVGFLFIPVYLQAWSDHALLIFTALKNHPVFSASEPVEVKSLRTFLLETQGKLDDFLQEQEKWSRLNLPNYKPCPDELAFKATGNNDDITDRFLSAIRINPHAKIPLYRQVLPGESYNGKVKMPLSWITTLGDTASLAIFSYIQLSEGEKIDPFSILCSASDEPDFGFDLGLFEDNNTDYGLKYGFGTQPFGNPNLEYSSQAPFHMGFFHEAKILYKFGPFLKETYIDYRIFLYRALSEFAFKNNQPYWGWRFLAWGMHYITDSSMPYHMKPLPGVSTSRMIWINLKAVVGAPGAKNRALQIVSNRHAVLESFQSEAIREALYGGEENPVKKSLQQPLEPSVEFSLGNYLGFYSQNTAESAKSIDQALKDNMPAILVSDPAIEATSRPEMLKITEAIRQKGGEDAVKDMADVLAGRMSALSMYVRSYLESVVKVAAVN